MNNINWTRYFSFFIGWKRVLIIGIFAIFVFWLVNFHGVPCLPQSQSLSNVGILDMDYGYTPDAAYHKLTAYGEQGRYAYMQFLLWIDFIYPAILSIFFVSIIATLASKYFHGRNWMFFLALIPIGMMFSDWIENVNILIMLNSYPIFQPFAAKVSMCFTLLKGVFGILSLVSLILILLILLLNRFIRKR